MASTYKNVQKIAVLLFAVISFKANEGRVISRVIPHEARRQGLNQQTPCPEDMVEFTCVLSDSSTTALRWTTNETTLYTFLISTDIGSAQTRIPGFHATLLNRTSSTLVISLSDVDINVNGTQIGCTDDGGSATAILTLTIIGPASAPIVTVHPEGLSTLTMDMESPVYGRECVDLYRATATVGGMTLPTSEQPVTDPTQTTYSFMFPGVDLCRDMLNSVTAVAITDGMEGTMANPVNTNVIARSRIITSPVSASQLFTLSRIEVTLSWQVIDRGIMPEGFNVTCSSNDASLSCQGVDVSATQLMISLPLSAIVEGQVVRFSIGYSYGLCVNSPIETELTVNNINSFLPQELRNQRAVRVQFNETLFDVNSVRVNFSSNCTRAITIDYSNPLLITIPDTGLNTGQCQYDIQLVDRAMSTLPIGYPVTGSFIAEGLPPPPATPSSDVNVGAIAGGIVGGVLSPIIVIVSVLVAMFARNKKKGIAQNHKESLDLQHVSVKKDICVYQDPNTIKHETAPTGDFYAMPGKKSNKKGSEDIQCMYSVPEKSKKTYGDSCIIEHETAPTGDFYAMPEKKSKKTCGLSYATLDVSDSHDKFSPQTPPIEYATIY